MFLDTRLQTNAPPLALRPVAYSEGLPVPERLESRNLGGGTKMCLCTIGIDVDDMDHL